MPNVSLSEVSKSFGKIRAVEGIDLEIADKEYLCILGPTGSGKTTLLRLIAGLTYPDEGTITINGKIVNKVSPEEHDVAYMPQQYSLFPHLTVLGNVAFGPTARGVTKEEAQDRAHKALEMVKLDHRAMAFPRELSGGMQQRVALARVIASGSKLLLLDEPLGALDARLRVELRYHLKSLIRAANLTAIHVTHDQREAMIVADRIVVLRTGRVEQIGTPYHVYQRPGSLFVANFVGEANFLEGVIKNVDQKGSLVELRDGLTVRVQETSYLVDEKIIVIVKQELTALHTGDNENSVNSLPGEVRTVHFLGDSIKIEVQLSNGDIINSRVPISKVDAYPKPKEKVVVSFRPEHAAIFCAPPKGLAKEIEVI